MNRRSFLKGLAISSIALSTSGNFVLADEEYDGAPWVFDSVNGFYRFKSERVTKGEFLTAMEDACYHLRFYGKLRAWPTDRGLYMDTTHGGHFTILALSNPFKVDFMDTYPFIKY